MAKTVSFKRLILRAVLRQVSPMVIRLVSVSDHMPLRELPAEEPSLGEVPDYLRYLHERGASEYQISSVFDILADTVRE
jgi:hypothetical protein